jgi:hypothetical protein
MFCQGNSQATVRSLGLRRRHRGKALRGNRPSGSENRRGKPAGVWKVVANAHRPKCTSTRRASAAWPRGVTLAKPLGRAQAIPGVGRVVGLTLLTHLPELGTLDRKPDYRVGRAAPVCVRERASRSPPVPASWSVPMPQQARTDPRPLRSDCAFVRGEHYHWLCPCRHRWVERCRE